MKKCSLILLLLIVITILTSCTQDRYEIDDQVYPVAIGCDKAINNKIRITIQFPTYKESSGASGSIGKKEGGDSTSEQENIVGDTLIETIEAPSLIEGINLLNTSTTRRISLVHVKMIIFSEEMAKEGIKDYLQPIARFREARRIVQVIVCRGNAEYFIKQNKTQIGESISKAIELSNYQSKNIGYFPQASFQDFYTATISPYRQAYSTYAGINKFKNLESLDDSSAENVSPLRTESNIYPGDIPRKGDRKIELIGTAIFNGDKMVGNLNAYETRYFLMVLDRYKRGIFTIKDKTNPEEAIILDISLGRKPKINAYFEDGVPVINVKLNIEADVVAIQSRIPYEKVKKIENLNKYVASVIQKGVLETISKTQQEWNTDIFGFGKKIAKNFFTINEFEQYNWLSHYKEAKIKVQVDANVRRTGLMITSAPIRNNKETVFSGGE